MKTYLKRVEMQVSLQTLRNLQSNHEKSIKEDKQVNTYAEMKRAEVWQLRHDMRQSKKDKS